MITAYRLVLFAAMYLAGFWLIGRYVFTPQYLPLLAWYDAFEVRLEEADPRSFIHIADAVSKVALVTVASVLAGFVLAAFLRGALHLAR